ncbi:MAG: O-antigen ligase family protein [Pyrinomonadaceae bacterium]|nr:O-antigen ligase family protein [Pyrinomonadaceae bacterium]MBP6214018.1 O-antigen ligase family protein [Pyrinomonadaceae bacterium]
MTVVNKLNFFLISACVVISALAYGTVHQPTIAVFYVAIASMLVIWAIDCFTSGAVRYSRSLIQIPVYATALYAFIQILPIGSIAETAGISGIPRTISLAPFATEATGLHYLALGIFLSLALVYIDSAARLKRVALIITIFGAVYAFYAILQSVLSPTKIYGIFERESPFGSFVNRHNFAAYIEMAVSIPMGMLFVGAVSRDKKLLYITGITVMCVALLLSGSRGGLVALLAQISLLIFLTTRAHGAKKVALRVALSVVLIGAVIVGAFFVGGETSLSRFAETAVSKDITTNRTHIWSITINAIKNNLPFGAGLGAFAQAYTPYDDFNGLERVEQAHNDYLQVLADAGLIGALIGGFLLFLIFRVGRQGISVENTFRRGVAVGALSGMFAILIHSIFDFVLHTTAVSVLFLTLFAMLAAATRKYKDDERNPDDHGHRRKRSSSKVAAFSKR